MYKFLLIRKYLLKRRIAWVSLIAVMLCTAMVIVVISVIFFALYLFLIDQAWVYVLEGLTWVVNKIAGY